MFNIFNSNVMIEIGEAIGNIGNKLFKKPKRNAEIVDQAFRNRLTSGTLPSLNLGDSAEEVDAEDVIDASFRVLDKEE